MKLFKIIRCLPAVIALAAIFLPAVEAANAAIPHSKTIVSRLARNSGKGVYIVEQELRFAGSEGIVLKERWLVQSSDVMRLVVQGTKVGDFRWDAVYRDGKRIASAPAAGALTGATSGAQALSEPGKEPRTSNISAEFFEPFLFHRSSARYFDAFVKNKILPASALRDRPRIANIATYKPTPEPAIRLGRTGGVVAWVFGEPTPVEAANPYPGAWIEQDTFLLRKLRLLSRAEMTLSNHTSSGGGLKMARERTIVWKPTAADSGEARSVTIKVTSVRHLHEKSLAPQFLGSSITASELKSARLPDAPVVREFYSRFR